MAEIQAEIMTDWITDDTHTVDINESDGDGDGEANGALENPSFPNTADSNESWTGTIDACNTGNASGTFRIALDGQTSEPFSIPANSCGTIEISGTGPAEFTITLQRQV